MTFSELTVEDLAAKYVAAERELTLARFQHGLGQLENTASLRHMRRDIARMQSEFTRRERTDGVAKGSLLSANRRSSAAAETPVGQSAPEKGRFLQGIVDKLTSND